MKNVTRMLVALTMLVAGTAANAAVIFDNGITATNGFISDLDFTGTPKLSADDFKLTPGANVITDVHWTGLYAFSNTPLADSFTLQLFNDAGGVPATNPFLSLPVNPSRVDTGNNTSFGSDIFAYDVNISPVTLAANTTFWLSIFNNTSNDTNDNWFWGMVDLAGNGATRDGLGLPWSPSVGNNGYQFQLTGVSVPEPSALALFGLGFIAIALLGRRRTSST